MHERDVSGSQGPPREGDPPHAATAEPLALSQLGFAVVSWGWIPTFFVQLHIPEQLGGDGHRLRLGHQANSPNLGPPKQVGLRGQTKLRIQPTVSCPPCRSGPGSPRAGSQPSASPAARGLLAGLQQSLSSLGATSSVPWCARRPPQWDRSQHWEEEVGCCGVVSGLGKAARSTVLLARPEPLPCHCGLAGQRGVCHPRATCALIPSQPPASPMVSGGSSARQQEMLF